ncbi:MAG: hypothetical protein AAF738_00685 [Bacteroidota bacterium]
MNLQKAAVLLDTINALYKRMEMNKGNIPAIERDLMLQNVRELYEFFVTQSTNTPPSPITMPQGTIPATKPRYTPPAKPKAEPVNTVRKVERAPDYKPPRIIELPEDVKSEVSTTPTYTAPTAAYTPPTSPPVPPKPVPPSTVTKKVEQKATPTPPKFTASKEENRPQFDTLFEHKAARELSEKLSERPIEDLTRAVGYNDKMLFTNELFGGELVAFNTAVSRINSMKSFTEARKYLAKLAEQNDWTNAKKTASAKSFIKLVRRRFGA